jgi:hypothetical protein
MMGDAMRNDLLDAQASIDWVISKLPSLQKRLGRWCDVNVHVRMKELPPDNPNNLLVAVPKKPFPLAFNVEVGAYINAIRSSLDILASALSARNRVSNNPDARFPIYRCLYDFIDPLGGLESIKWLSQTERTIVKSLNPYQGGNDLLWRLHQLDIMRKHRRLLSVSIRPATFSIMGWGLSHHYTPVSTGFMQVNNEETVLGFVPKGSTAQYNMKLTAYVYIEEVGIGTLKPPVSALNDFASLATSIVKRFDV